MNTTPTKPFWQSGHVWRAMGAAALTAVLPQLPALLPYLPWWGRLAVGAIVAVAGGANAISARAQTATGITLTKGDDNG